jgi:hypothetical protein
LGRALLAAAALVTLASAYFGTTLDDAFITAQFAHELAHTGAITWQGDRIEGYSNFLLVLLEALAATLGADVIRLAGGIALGCGVALVGLVSYALPQDRRGDLPLGAFVLWAPLAYWSAIPFETTLFGLLSAAGLWLTLRRPTWGALLLWLAALCRPEGTLCFLMGGALAWRLLGLRQLRSFALPALLVAGYHAFRLAYFGTLLPSAVELKAQLGARGVVALVPDLLCAAGVLSIGGLSLRVERAKWGWVLAPLLLGAVLQIAGNGDWMARSRLLLPGVAGSLLLAARLGEARALSPRARMSALPVALAASLLLPRFMQLPELRRLAPSLAQQEPPLLEPLVWLARHAPRDALIQSADIGMLGHLPLARVVDSRGLTSSRFRTAKARGVSQLSSFYAGPQAPDIIQVNRFAPVGVLPAGPRVPEGLDPWLREVGSVLARYPAHQDLHFREGAWLGASRLWLRGEPTLQPPSLVRARFRALAERFPSIPRFAQLAQAVPRDAVAP